MKTLESLEVSDMFIPTKVLQYKLPIFYICRVKGTPFDKTIKLAKQIPRK